MVTITIAKMIMMMINFLIRKSFMYQNFVYISILNINLFSRLTLTKLQIQLNHVKFICNQIIIYLLILYNII